MAGNTLRFRATLDDKVSSPLDKMRGKFDTLGSSKGFKAVAQGIGMGGGIAAFNLLGGAVDGATQFVFDSISAASDLNETLGKSQIVFGKSAGQIEKWGDTATTSMGLSKRAAIESAATFGNLFTSMGVVGDASVDMSKSVVQLAADLGAFNNVPTEEALQALQSALVGESEPMRKFGVNISAAAVDQKALNMHLADSKGTISEAAKVQARYALILEGTTTAQGNFAATSDQLAEKQKTLDAKMQNLSATIGTVLVPAMDSGVTVVLGLATAFETLSGSTRSSSEDVLKTQQALIDFERAIPIWASMNDAILDQQQKLHDDAAEAIRFQRVASFMSDHVKDDFVDISGHAITMGDKIGGVTDDIVVSFDDMLKALERDVDGLIGKVYDPAINHAKLLADKVEAADLRRVISSSKSTAAEIRDARDRLLSLSKDADQTRLNLLESGDLTADETKTWLTKLEKKYKTSTGAARARIGELIDDIHRLAKMTAPGIDVTVAIIGPARGPAGKKKASGGPVDPWEAYTVGEHGTETLVMGSRGGTIVPHGAGGGVTINLTYAPKYSTATTAEAMRFAREATPELVREMRRQKVL